MRKLAIIVAMMSVLAGLSLWAVPNHTAAQLNSPQIAGDVGPNGG